MKSEQLGQGNQSVQGLSIEQSGGDGLFVDNCERVHIADVTADGNYRQGMSIIGAKHMLVERCNFSNTCVSQLLIRSLCG